MRAFLLAAAALTLAACSHNAPVRDATPATAAGGGDTFPAGTPGVPEPPSARGNPAFYEVWGQRYYTLRTARGYRERGLASWYGTKFHGESTSSGEPYDMFAMTAAHRSLPLPSWVEVTRVDNGRRIVVRVNDRGPFVEGRIIDLSYAAARALDMIDDGTAMVEVRALESPRDISPDAIVSSGVAARPVVRTPDADGPPPSAGTSLRASGNPLQFEPVVLHAPAAPAQAAAAPAQAAPAPARNAAPAALAARSLYVQLGAFSRRDNAEQLRSRLQAAGFGGAFVLGQQEAGDGLYRVRIGPVADAAAYDALVERLARLDIRDVRLIDE